MTIEKIVCVVVAFVCCAIFGALRTGVVARKPVRAITVHEATPSMPVAHKVAIAITAVLVPAYILALSGILD